MSREGSYAKGKAKREEILDAALDVVARYGYGHASLRELAEAVNLTQAGVLHYFDSKEELFTELLRHRDELNSVARGGSEPIELAEAHLALLERNASVPGLMQLYVHLGAEATGSDGPAHRFFLERYARYRAEIAATVDDLKVDGVVPPEADSEAMGRILLAVVDGLQLQWLLEPDFDLAGHVRLLLSGLGLPLRA